MKSRKKLFEALQDLKAHGWALTLPSRPEGLSDEVFGRTACIFFGWPSVDQRGHGESLLEAQGFKVNRAYWPGSARSEVVVSYFKGWHWNE